MTRDVAVNHNTQDNFARYNAKYILKNASRSPLSLVHQLKRQVETSYQRRKLPLERSWPH